MEQGVKSELLCDAQVTGSFAEFHACAEREPVRSSRHYSDEPFWRALRECRRQIAAEHGLPPYLIFHDATLKQMIAERPADAEALLAIGGVGRAKLERYGEHFLSVIRAHDAERAAAQR